MGSRNLGWKGQWLGCRKVRGGGQVQILRLCRWDGAGLISLQWKPLSEASGTHTLQSKGDRETSEEAEVPVGRERMDVEKLLKPERSGR